LLSLGRIARSGGTPKTTLSCSLVRARWLSSAKSALDGSEGAGSGGYDASEGNSETSSEMGGADAWESGELVL
jgi:hypothetical protein